MTQKDFAKATGIAQSTISDWKRRKVNPASDKIMIISEVLGVTPYEILSGVEHVGNRSRKNTVLVISKNSELGKFIENYQSLDESKQKCLQGYLDALKERL